jgi:hypothetical protein
VASGGDRGAGGGEGRSPHEAAVRAALQAGVADESQRETFTRVEEVAVTTETVERFVEHHSFQREYVIVVSGWKKERGRGGFGGACDARRVLSGQRLEKYRRG